MSDAARYLRQVLLPEIGPVGQQRIGASTVALGGSGTLAGEVAELYARGAGFGRVAQAPAAPAGVAVGVAVNDVVVLDRIDMEVLAPTSVTTTPAAREVLAGARAALAAMRAAVGAGAASLSRSPSPSPSPRGQS